MQFKLLDEIEIYIKLKKLVAKNTHLLGRFKGLVGGFVSDTFFAHFVYALVDFSSPTKESRMERSECQRHERYSSTPLTIQCAKNLNICSMDLSMHLR